MTGVHPGEMAEKCHAVAITATRESFHSLKSVFLDIFYSLIYVISGCFYSIKIVFIGDL